MDINKGLISHVVIILTFFITLYPKKKKRESWSQWCVMQDGEQMTETNVLICVRFFVFMSFSLRWSPLRKGLEGIPLFLWQSSWFYDGPKCNKWYNTPSKVGLYVTVTTKACSIKKQCLNSWATSSTRSHILNTPPWVPSNPHTQRN